MYNSIRPPGKKINGQLSRSRNIYRVHKYVIPKVRGGGEEEELEMYMNGAGLDDGEPLGKADDRFKVPQLGYQPGKFASKMTQGQLLSQLEGNVDPINRSDQILQYWHLRNALSRSQHDVVSARMAALRMVRAARTGGLDNPGNLDTVVRFIKKQPRRPAFAELGASQRGRLQSQMAKIQEEIDEPMGQSGNGLYGGSLSVSTFADPYANDRPPLPYGTEGHTMAYPGGRGMHGGNWLKKAKSAIGTIGKVASTVGSLANNSTVQGLAGMVGLEGALKTVGKVSSTVGDVAGKIGGMGLRGRALALAGVNASQRVSSHPANFKKMPPPSGQGAEDLKQLYADNITEIIGDGLPMLGQGAGTALFSGRGAAQVSDMNSDGELWRGYGGANIKEQFMDKLSELIPKLLPNKKKDISASADAIASAAVAELTQLKPGLRPMLASVKSGLVDLAKTAIKRLWTAGSGLDIAREKEVIRSSGLARNLGRRAVQRYAAAHPDAVRGVQAMFEKHAATKGAMDEVE